MMTHDASLARLKEMYPWPATRPAVSPIDWAMDGGGRSLVTDAIRKHNLKVILEVGVFLGGSLRTWLEASPDVVVLAVDPWEGTWGGVARRFGHPEYAEQLDRDNGPYESFLSSLWEYRDRVIPIAVTHPTCSTNSLRWASYQICSISMQISWAVKSKSATSSFQGFCAPGTTGCMVT